MDHECSVVIATRNRPDRLRLCLAGLLDQSVTDIEVIVVDDASDTPLEPVVRSQQFSSLDITCRRLETQSGPAAARNVGAELVSTPYVLFIDDDIRADWRMVETHLAVVRSAAPGEPPIVSCGPFVEPADWNPTPWNKWEAVQMKREAENLIAGRFPVTWRQFHTGNNCMPIELFRRAGGFDGAFKRAEDDEFALRLAKLGCEFRFEPNAIGWHYAHRSLESWLAIPRSYAVYDVHLDQLHPDSGYLRRRKAELDRRRPEMRAVRAMLTSLRLTSIGVSVTVAAARALYRVGLVTPSMWALSVAYDLGYVDALRTAEAADTLDQAESRVLGGR